MKSSALFPFLFTALASAGPILRQCGAQPSTSQISAAITNWTTDVNTVNAFLNNPSQAGAQNALNFAQDEPHELSMSPSSAHGDIHAPLKYDLRFADNRNLAILASICGVTQPYTDAVNNLKAVFGGVTANLQAIIGGGNVESLVEGINNIRCCNVLPDLDVLWLEAAEQAGIVGTVNTNVPRPDACAVVQC
jgi:hypothetical protein